MNSIEIEYRGPLENIDIEKLKNKLHSQFKISNFSTSSTLTIFPQGSLDLRIKIRDNRIYLVYKKRVTKTDASDEKIEIDKEIQEGDLETIFNLYKLLDISEVVYAASKVFNFEFDVFTFSIKYGDGITFWELDTVIKEGEERKNLKQGMEEIIKVLDLKQWDPNEWEEIKKSIQASTKRINTSDRQELESTIRMFIQQQNKSKLLS